MQTDIGHIFHWKRIRHFPKLLQALHFPKQAGPTPESPYTTSWSHVAVWADFIQDFNQFPKWQIPGKEEDIIHVPEMLRERIEGTACLSEKSHMIFF